MHDLGKFEKLGELWIRILNELYTNGKNEIYTDNPGEEYEVKELMGLTAEIKDAVLPDDIIERYKVQEEYDWMVRNFTVQEEVEKLNNQNSYASRLYSYMGKKDQVKWLIEKLKQNPKTRSATLTMFEPLTDEWYIPCVSLLDFQEENGKLNMTAYCRALDFGCKAYINLVMLWIILNNISKDVDMPCGKLVLVIKSAHYYLRDKDKVENILKLEKLLD
ncbi:MAG: thymidylate synthase [Eubacteriales bacterium]|nr:thymidylate synthase [Eubacteriales bacterium]